MPSDPVSGLYEQLVTVELKRLLGALEPSRVDVESPMPPTPTSPSRSTLRRIIERALRAVPEDERLTRQAELCNAVLVWLRDEGQAAESAPLARRSSSRWRSCARFGRLAAAQRSPTRHPSPWFRCRRQTCS